jgi:hypothetical protein
VDRLAIALYLGVVLMPAVLGEFATLRNPAAHRVRVQREEATMWRNQLAGVGCLGHLTQLGRTRPA